MRAWMLVVAFVFTPLLAQEPTPAYRSSRISYLTSATVYIDAGRDDGVDMGQVLEVLRGGEVIATLKVTDVSSHRAVCARQDGSIELVVGDTVRFVPRATLPPAEPTWPSASTSAGRNPEKGGRRDVGLHGRVGVRYLAVKGRQPDDSSFSQPALDLRLDGTQVGGAPIDLMVDVRSRTTYRTLTNQPTESDNQTSVYRMAVSWRQEGSPWRLTAGRTLSPSLAVIDIFDGVEGQYTGRRWNAGLFSGTQPVEGDLGYSSDVREHGGYVGVRSEASSERRWALTTGLIGSYTQGEINREFSYLQGSYIDRKLSVWMTQETDLNRGWRKEVEGESVSMSSTFLNLRFRASDMWTMFAGYDNRRNVRLYRDRITPVTEFDDAYRQGTWGGVTCRFAGHFTIGADARFSDGGSAGSADGYTLTLGADRLTRAQLQFHSRSTRYTNDRVEGWLHALSAGVAAGSRWYIGIDGGVRDETNLSSSVLESTLTWYGLQVDVTLGRHWFASVTGESSSGGDGAQDQVYASVTYRF